MHSVDQLPINAVIGNLKYWDWTCPVMRLTGHLNVEAGIEVLGCVGLMMKSNRIPMLVTFVLVGVSSSVASPIPQNKRSKSDADIKAIGHRSIVHDTNFYSSQKEKELGKSLSQEVERKATVLKDPAITVYVERVAQNVAHNSDAHFPVTVTVIDSDSVNAFTLAGGYQYITRGLLLRLEGEGELASVLARGIAHTALRSATREATKSQMMQLATIPAAPLGTAGPTPNDINLAIPLTSLKMRRDDELDADYFGVQYLYKAGYDPKAFTDFILRVWGTSTAGEKLPTNLSTFPPVDERLADLRKEISELLPPRADAKVSTPDFDAFKEHLRTHAVVGPETHR
jgi:predicted Zn-dependent protease